jgi:hypothetical protein
MKQRTIFATFLALCGASVLWGHHSLTAEYDQKKPVSLNGTLTKLDWRNPHAWIYIDVKNAAGGVDNWRCELGSPNAMTRAGFTQNSVMPGEEIVLEGLLAKQGSNICSTRVVKSKDGRTLLSQSEQR